MPAPTTAVEFLELVKKSGLVEPDAYTQVTEATLPPDPSQAAGVFIKRGWLTNFQAKQLLAGRYRGFRIGPYVVREQIGQGGMGIVYLAEHEQLRRRVALKVLTGPPTDARNVTLERFLREARAAAALDHPNIVRIHDVGQSGHIHYLVMEYVDGRTFDEVIASGGPVAAGRAVTYIAQAAAGLQHAHEKGFIHRDIKPGNLMLQADGTVKILDMGLARSFDNPNDKLTEQFDAGAVVGTADFISPEQALNDPTIDHRADIYSLGATFYALVTGQPPFTGNTTQKLMQHQMKEAPPLTAVDKTFPAELSDVIARMMAKQPEKRYDSMAEVIDALAPWMPEGLGPTANLVRRSSTGSLRHTAVRQKGALPPWAVYATAVGGLAVVLGVVLWAWYKPNPDAGREPPSPPTGNGATPAATTKTNTPAPKTTPAPKSGPKPKPPAAKSPSTDAGLRTAYQLNPTGAKPFLARVVCEGTDSDRTNRVVSKSGDGLPAGWDHHVWRTGATAEFFASDETGSQAVGIRTIEGKAGGILFLPETTAPDSRSVIKFEYKSSKPGTPFGVKFRARGAPASAAFYATRLTATTAWTTATVPIDQKGAATGRAEILLEDDEPDATLWVRNVAIQVPTAAPAGVAKTVFQFDPKNLGEFRVRKVKHTITTGQMTAFPPGTGVTCWKDDSEGEFWKEIHRESPTLALASHTQGDLVTAQLGVELEASAGVTLAEGKRYKLIVTYATTGTGRGNMYFQFSDYTSISGQRDLPNTGGEWKTVETSVIRGERSLRFLIDTKASGLENALLIREVRVVED